MSRLVAVVLNWNGGEVTLDALDSLRGVETICVDNGSTDGSDRLVEERHPEVELIRTGRNLGFSGGNNVGIRRALERGADWVLLLNNDAVAGPGLPAALDAAASARPDAGVLACKVFFAEPPDVLMYAGARFGRGSATGAVRTGSGAGTTAATTACATSGARRGRRWRSRAPRSSGQACSTISCSPTARTSSGACGSRERGSRSSSCPTRRPGTSAPRRPAACARPASLYYDTRNLIVVCERFAPLPPGLRALRRLVVVVAHLLGARSAAGAAAVLAGWRDARRGRLGQR